MGRQDVDRLTNIGIARSLVCFDPFALLLSSPLIVKSYKLLICLRCDPFLGSNWDLFLLGRAGVTTALHMNSAEMPGQLALALPATYLGTCTASLAPVGLVKVLELERSGIA